MDLVTLFVSLRQSIRGFRSFRPRPESPGHPTVAGHSGATMA
jgi:hypothetical protein